MIKESNKTLSYIVTTEQQQADCLMAVYDAWGTQAHVAGLGKIGVMQPAEVKAVLQVLEDIKQVAEQGDFPYDPALGAQLTLEKLVTDQVGKQTGGKIHTGRSRNDQVLVTQKLYVRDTVLQLLESAVQLAEAFIQLGQKHLTTVMPGYTHMQPAKPTSFAQWCASYADMLIRDIDRIQATYERHNFSPLGAAESYGTSWPLDRLYVAKLLAFDGVQEIPADTVGNRGEYELELLADYSLLMNHLSKCAQDVLLMTTFESGQVTLGEQVAEQMGKLTGSSIMPQKKNPDVLELIRANASIVHGQLFQGMELLKALPMGYNRDSRETKELIMTGHQRSKESIEQLVQVITCLQVNTERMAFLVKENYSLSTDLADYLSQQYGLPYRIAYRIVGTLIKQFVSTGKKLYELTPHDLAQQALEEGIELQVTNSDLQEALDPLKALARRTHVGGANAGVMEKLLGNRLETIATSHAWIDKQDKKIKSAIDGISVLISSL